MPRAMSSESDPVEIAPTVMLAVASPIFMMAPLPYCFSIWLSARSSARFRSASFWAMSCSPVVLDGNATVLERLFATPDSQIPDASLHACPQSTA